MCETARLVLLLVVGITMIAISFYQSFSPGQQQLHEACRYNSTDNVALFSRHCFEFY